MAWPRIKNSRSSAQPGTQPHNGVQATVTPAPDAEPPPGSGQNAGVSGTRHSVAYEQGGYGPGAPGPAAARPRAGRRLRPIRYAHSAADETVAPTVPVAAAGPPADTVSPNTVSPNTGGSGEELSGTVSGPVLSGTVVTGPAPVDDDRDDDATAGLVYEAPRSAYTRPSSTGPSSTGPSNARPAHAEPPEPEPAAPVPNEGLKIFGDVATTEVPDDDDDDVPARDYERPSSPEPTRVIPIGATWNQPVSAQARPSDEAGEDRRPGPFERVRGIWTGGQPADDDSPRVSVRDLPPDVQLRFWRLRITIMVVVGAVFAVITRSWEVALTLAILAGIVDTIYRSRNAAHYVNGRHPGARRATSKQLVKMRREGYFVLNDRPIPGSDEVIDHLVVGPTGVYAIDSEKWDAKLPIRTLNGKRLYLGPESQKPRLEHAVWEAGQATEILSAALGSDIAVRPALAVYGPKIPWDIATIRNVDVFTGPALRKYLKRRGRMKDGVVKLTREEVRTIYDTAARMLPDATASPRTATPVG